MSEKHLPGIGGAFDRLVFDEDGTAWVREKTCTVEKFEQNPSYGDYYCELSCHWFDVVDDMPPAYCPICGAKVVEP